MRPAAVMYSLLMIALLCLSSASVIQAQTACTGNAQVADGEVEAGGIDGVDSALVGEWTTWHQTLEARLTLLANGRFVNCVTSYTQRRQNIVMGRWYVADGDFQSQADAAPEGRRPQRLKLEKITASAFRLSGDNLKLATLLYRRVTPQNPMPYPGHWLVSTWRRNIVDGLSQFVAILALGADGRYRTTTRTYPEGEVVDVQQGSWRLTPQVFFFTRDGESEQSYPLDLVTTNRVTFIVNGTKVAFNRNSTPSVDGVDPFAGQFVTTGAGNVTLQLSRDGQGGYRGTVIEQGRTHPATGQVANGRLSLTIPGFRIPLVVFPFYNALSALSFDGTLGRRRILAGELCYDNAEWIGLGG